MIWHTEWTSCHASADTPRRRRRVEKREGHTSNISSQCWLMSCFAAEMDELMSVVTRVLVTRTLVTLWHRGLTSRHNQANNQIVLTTTSSGLSRSSSNPKSLPCPGLVWWLNVTKNYKSVTVAVPLSFSGISREVEKTQVKYLSFKVIVNSFFTFSYEVYPLPLQFAMFSLVLLQPRITKKLLSVFQFSEECSLFGDRFPGSKGWFPLNMHFVTQ